MKSESEVAQSCLTLGDPMDPPGSSIHWIFQARVLEWGAIAFSVWLTTMCISIPVWQRTPWKVLCHTQALWSYSKYYDLSLSYFKGLIISTFILNIEITLYAAPSPSWNISTAVPRKVTSLSCSGSGHQNILHLQFSKFTNNPAIIKVCEKKNPLSPAFYIYRVSLKPEKKYYYLF